MENLISHLEGPNKHIINLVKLDGGEVINSTSKWLSDRWFLRQTLKKFSMRRTSARFKNKKRLKYICRREIFGA